MEENLANQRYRILSECGFEYEAEISQGYAIWKTNPDRELWLFAKPYGSFHNFTLVSAITKEEAIEKQINDSGIYFIIKSEEQIKIILNSI